MKKILFLLITLISLGSLSAQEKAAKVKKSEAKSIVKELTQDEKIKLLNEVIANHPKILDQALIKAIRKTDKKKIDGFMARKGKDFKVLSKDKIVQRDENVQKTSKTIKKTTTPKKVEAPKVEKVDDHAGHNHQDHEGHDHSATGKVKTPAEAKPKPTYIVKDVNAPPATTIEFEEISFDFGTLTDGESVTHTYVFKNTGDHPYIITNAKGSCGCTVPKWSREPIAPGATSEIVVTFNSRGKGRAGGANQSKRVTITGNTEPAQTYLTIKGIVNK